MNYSKLKPAVNRKWLLVISGLMWSGVGIFTSVIIGLLAGLTIARFGFGNIANKNVGRILSYPKHACVFAFQEWKSYILIAVMMGMGIYLRTTGLVPKFILAPLYIGIGTALFLSSFK
ncbi:MAG: hypothetical protein MUP82_08645 [Candidatus Marinimicrobia bacterium]|nr:hypothetical protein [Candidatus Neomarinimicrobiota bacterium]